jgi:DUF1680 family protein
VTSLAALRLLPLGSIKPAGWLGEQLRLQAAGLTGALEEIWPDVGPRSAWLGGDGEDWERGPYYIDGLVPLAHLTGDPDLLAKADKWVDAIVGSQRDDGQFGPRSNDDWWPRMVALKALVQHHEATGEPRILDLMARYFRYQAGALPARPLRDWGRVRGADNALTVLWLHDRTGDPALAELAGLILDQTADWEGYLDAFPCTGVTTRWDHMTHVVNVAMGIKTSAVRWLLDGDPEHRRRSDAAWANLQRHHGQVHGMFSGDEWLAGTDPQRGVELCAVVEAMYSFEEMGRIWGSAAHADLLERMAWNLLPATLSADLTSHQYHQQANQVLATIEQREWTQAGDDCTIFGLEPNFGCCTANLHQGWPKLVRSMWMADAGSGLVTQVHGPCEVRHQVDGAELRFVVDTSYPFDERIAIRVNATTPVRMGLRLRVPGWCAHPQVMLDGAPTPAGIDDGFIALDRTWSDGDLIEVRLPMPVDVKARPSGGIGVTLGPLVLAYSPGEIWSRIPGSEAFGDWEVRPRRSWNMAIALQPGDATDRARVERLGPQSPPFGLRTGPPPYGIEGVPLKVWVPGRRADTWRLKDGSAPSPPRIPTEESHPDRLVPLVPYGSARLRIAELPMAPPSERGLRARAESPP